VDRRLSIVETPRQSTFNTQQSPSIKKPPGNPGGSQFKSKSTQHHHRPAIRVAAVVVVLVVSCFISGQNHTLADKNVKSYGNIGRIER
jgi:hypothetical protein